jgi:hypothetical protein
MLNSAIMVLSMKYSEPLMNPLYMLPGAQALFESELLVLMNTSVSYLIPGARVRFVLPGDKIKPTQTIFVKP